MRRKLFRGTGLSILILLAGLTAESRLFAQAGKGTGKQSAHAELIKALKSAHTLLAQADRDYDGHRATAAEEVHKALKELGYEHPHKKEATTKAGVAAPKKAAHAKQPAVHEPQAISDAQLREAREILEKALPHLNDKHPKAAANVKVAITEIKTALSIK